MTEQERRRLRAAAIRLQNDTGIRFADAWKKVTNPDVEEV